VYAFQTNDDTSAQFVQHYIAVEADEVYFSAYIGSRNLSSQNGPSYLGGSPSLLSV
jgi:hypothetical protein